jgi:putative flippase GtrA
VAELAPSSPLSLKTQVVRFIVTGGFSAVVDYGLNMLLHFGLGMQADLAKTLSFIAGTLTAYLINRRWTFQASPSKARFIAVMVLYALTFVVQVGLYHLILNAMHGTATAATVAFVIAQGTATVINFIVQRVWIFRLR